MKFNNNYFKDPIVLEELVSKLIGPIYLKVIVILTRRD